MAPLARDITVFERGWLSSNNILIQGQTSCALIDSGYVTHSAQTVALLKQALGGRPLDLLVNTHLHSDHCGGNAALQTAYPALMTHIPPGLSEHVRQWDPQALSYSPTGQRCPQFRFDALLTPGTQIRLGDKMWQVHGAPGHDPHSVILFEPTDRVLVSADALWQRGFGVVFPEMEGLDAFEDVAKTIDLIDSLSPSIVIPGHGPVFANVAPAIVYARERLRSFVANPVKHIKHAVKVLLKFKLLEVQSMELSALVNWAQATPYFLMVYRQYFSEHDYSQWINDLLADLVRAGAASRDAGVIRNAG
jgi:glyoxylase-like metal-dependent hydrolase (beta-lactamase superfamily II)